jgi:molecular chaperone DnaK (HSP70)
MEVAGRTIGAGIDGGPVDVIFERSTPLPAKVNRTFYTERNGQTEMLINLFEDSKSRIDESRMLGQLHYKGLTPAPAGEGSVDLSFMLDQDGILHVSALIEGMQLDNSIRLD